MTRRPVSSSESRFFIISVHVICRLTDFHIYMCTLIIKFNSIQKDAYDNEVRNVSQVNRQVN